MSAILCGPGRASSRPLRRVPHDAYESAVNGGETRGAGARRSLPGVRASRRRTGRLQPRRAGAGSHAVHAGDVFAADCHCREMLDQSMRMIAEAGCGAVIYLHNTSRGFEIEHMPVSEEALARGRGCLAWQAGKRWRTPHTHRELRAREGAQARTGRNLRAIGWRTDLSDSHPAHSPAVQYADAHSGSGRVRLEIVEQVAIPVEECSRRVG